MYIHPSIEQGGVTLGSSSSQQTKHSLIHTEDQFGVTTSTVSGASKATQTRQLDPTAESGSWSGCV